MSCQNFRTDRRDLKTTNLNPNRSVRKTLTSISKSQGLSIQIHNIHEYTDCTSIYDNKRAHHLGELENAFQISLFWLTLDHNGPDRNPEQYRLFPRRLWYGIKFWPSKFMSMIMTVPLDMIRNILACYQILSDLEWLNPWMNRLDLFGILVVPFHHFHHDLVL